MENGGGCILYPPPPPTTSVITLSPVLLCLPIRLKAKVYTLVMMLLIAPLQYYKDDDGKEPGLTSDNWPRLTTSSCCMEFLYLFSFPVSHPPYYLYAAFIGDRYSVAHGHRTECRLEISKGGRVKFPPRPPVK